MECEACQTFYLLKNFQALETLENVSSFSWKNILAILEKKSCSISMALTPSALASWHPSNSARLLHDTGLKSRRNFPESPTHDDTYIEVESCGIYIYSKTKWNPRRGVKATINTYRRERAWNSRPVYGWASSLQMCVGDKRHWTKKNICIRGATATINAYRRERAWTARPVHGWNSPRRLASVQTRVGDTRHWTKQMSEQFIGICW